MEFWGKERLLRGVLQPAQAVVLGVAWGAALFALAFAITGETLFSCLAAAPLVVAGYVDSIRHLLPDPLLVIAVCMVVLGGILDTRLGLDSAIAGACGMAAGYAISLVTSLGRGDAKLLGVLGVWLGADLPVALVLAVVGAGLWSCCLMVTGRATSATAIPLGPWLVGGAICTLIGWTA